MRLGGLFPWSAFDLAKGIGAALAIGLGVTWGKRATGKWTAGLWMGGVLLFASGARWLLLLLPTQIVAQAGKDLALLGSGAETASTLARALGSAWVIEGGPPSALPFAFVNGIVQPLVLYLQTGPVSMGLIAVMLLLILFPEAALDLGGHRRLRLLRRRKLVRCCCSGLAAVIVIVRHGQPASEER
jgi:hypothetical protein